ncbi:ABC transporter ATP-binding protein [Shewanella sp. Choline-02u-19]|jgi:putative hydroxymethylpyrimidine transport system substrate-binding protein|uniref:ABC transporter substrate-binding protein n=1 Tax=unclassified Shewanella TaxID=196818 RepID=UPI000C32A369|nr:MULTISPECIES: ABC transporter substrate-binding protein [unclassified Shewanella]PKG75425.1 ABC transporter ATP-binding protein [Shewanella sp. GutCb]PKH56154.1 ABC transporter ATP-binding protein [Shewanella sp. Bg11-22]PKI27309.1 ABC transporter ATP-binding protein [Shewanella sp. Choline-02u-19]
MKKIMIKGAMAVLIASYSLMASAEDKAMTLMLDWFVNPNHGPVVIAQQKGYFKEEGLNITIQEPADPSMPAKLVAANNVDLAISYQTSLTIDVAAGLPLIRSATLIATPLNTLMVLDNGNINSLADLKGKKVGISIAGNEEATIGTMLKTEGVDFSEIKIINVGWALSSSLASGKVDAIWGGLRNFETNQLALEGYKAKSFFPEEHGVPSYDELVFVANAKTYDAEALKKFNHAIEKATQFIVNHPEEAWRTFVSYAPDTLNNELNKRAWNDTLTRFALRPAAVDLQRYDRFSAFMYQHKIIKTLPKAQDFVPVL